MTRRLGENLQRELNADPHASELWQALQTKKEDRETGHAMLAELAASGSSLAMMYLGAAYLEEALPIDPTHGEEWLRRSATAGSIEGRVQLSMLYKRQGRWTEVETELKALAEQSYAPAMETLGCLIYEGKLGSSSVAEAVNYISHASQHGHLFAKGRLAYLHRKERLGFRRWAIAQWDCVRGFPVYVRYRMKYSNSDRLRRI